MAFVPLSSDLERIATQIVDAAYKIHKKLGPGLLESVYEACLVYELQRRGLRVDRQVPVDIVYEELRIEAGLRLDLLVEGEVIIEIKAVEKMNEIFAAQLISYLKLTGKRLGFLINFNVPLIKDGIQRIVN
jgi:GxxExxY protein